MAESTPTQALADAALGTSVREWALYLRSKGASWRAISWELNEATDGEANVSHETLRTWCQEGKAAS